MRFDLYRHQYNNLLCHAWWIPVKSKGTRYILGTCLVIEGKRWKLKMTWRGGSRNILQTKSFLSVQSWVLDGRNLQEDTCLPFEVVQIRNKKCQRDIYCKVILTESIESASLLPCPSSREPVSFFLRCFLCSHPFCGLRYLLADTFTWLQFSFLLSLRIFPSAITTSNIL